ncbi:hypothetical protein HPDP_00284 [Candidatus Hepatincola sp. Pdp]
MAVISLELLKALKKAGVEEKLAEKAALEVASSKEETRKQDKKIDALATKFDVLATKVNILISLNIAMFCTMIATLFAVILLFAK